MYLTLVGHFVMWLWKQLAKPGWAFVQIIQPPVRDQGDVAVASCLLRSLGEYLQIVQSSKWSLAARAAFGSTAEVKITFCPP